MLIALIYLIGFLIAWIVSAFLAERDRQRGDPWVGDWKADTPTKCIGFGLLTAAWWPLVVVACVAVYAWDLLIHKIWEWAGNGLEWFVRKTT